MALDLGRAIPLLHSPNEGVVRRTLRRLHIRFWHAPAARLTELLLHAGAPTKIRELLKQIVETCRVCRHWQRAGPKSVASYKLATAFNHIVQWDILFHRKHMISHLICCATRWTVASLLKSRAAEEIIANITMHWIRQHGPMKVLVADQERGLMSDEAAQWLDRWQIELKTKVPGAHAQIVERHHDILRQLILRVEMALAEQGIAITTEVLVAECSLVKNLIVSVGGHCPYQGLYGTMPPLMSEFEPLSETMLDDAGTGIPGVSRHHHRVREIVVQEMVGVTAKDRAERANRSRTRPAIQMQELQPGDLVDFHRPPDTKDDSGWRGPAKVLSIEDDHANVQWQQRPLQVRAADLRRALVYMLFYWFFAGENRCNSPSALLISFADGLNDKVIRVGWVKAQQWCAARANEHLSEVLLAVLHVAGCGLHLKGCIGARIGSGASTLEGIVECDASFLWWWRRGRAGEAFYLETPGTSRLVLSSVFGPSFKETSFVQFLMVGPEDVEYIRQREPDIPNVGGPYDPEVVPPQRMSEPTERMSDTQSNRNVSSPSSTSSASSRSRSAVRDRAGSWAPQTSPSDDEPVPLRRPGTRRSRSESSAEGSGSTKPPPSCRQRRGLPTEDEASHGSWPAPSGLNGAAAGAVAAAGESAGFDGATAGAGSAEVPVPDSDAEDEELLEAPDDEEEHPELLYTEQDARAAAQEATVELLDNVFFASPPDAMMYHGPVVDTGSFVPDDDPTSPPELVIGGVLKRWLILDTVRDDVADHTPTPTPKGAEGQESWFVESGWETLVEDDNVGIVVRHHYSGQRPYLVNANSMC